MRWLCVCHVVVTGGVGGWTGLMRRRPTPPTHPFFPCGANGTGQTTSIPPHTRTHTHNAPVSVSNRLSPAPPAHTQRPRFSRQQEQPPFSPAPRARSPASRARGRGPECRPRPAGAAPRRGSRTWRRRRRRRRRGGKVVREGGEDKGVCVACVPSCMHGVRVCMWVCTHARDAWA